MPGPRQRAGARRILLPQAICDGPRLREDSTKHFGISLRLFRLSLVKEPNIYVHRVDETVSLDTAVGWFSQAEIEHAKESEIGYLEFAFTRDADFALDSIKRFDFSLCTSVAFQG